MPCHHHLKSYQSESASTSTANALQKYSQPSIEQLPERDSKSKIEILEYKESEAQKAIQNELKETIEILREQLRDSRRTSDTLLYQQSNQLTAMHNNHVRSLEQSYNLKLETLHTQLHDREQEINCLKLQLNEFNLKFCEQNQIEEIKQMSLILSEFEERIT